MPATDEDPWQETLGKLERRVRDAASQLRQLTQSRQLLDDKVRELERRLSADPAQADALAEAARWDAERTGFAADRARWDTERAVFAAERARWADWEAERGAERSRWEAERDDIRRRVEVLTAELERLAQTS
jgi:gamma-glutamyl:cysteine ligase YbdK (ATP-grasp superfamily)